MATEWFFAKAWDLFSFFNKDKFKSCWLYTADDKELYFELAVL